MTPISGAVIANQIKEELRQKNLGEGIEPCLAVILLGELADSLVYVNLKKQAVQYIGGRFQLERLPAWCSKAELFSLINKLNQDDTVDGIILQLPLPGELEPYRDEFLAAVSPSKDVDGFHPQNRGLLLGGEPGFVSCAAQACLEVINRYIPALSGQRINLIGTSFDLIMPLALMLLGKNCQVSIFPHFSYDALLNCDAAVIEEGGPLVVKKIAGNSPGLLIDAGFYYLDNASVGNVSQKDLDDCSGHLLPVPGGLGPILIAKLMENLNLAARGGNRCRNI